MRALITGGAGYVGSLLTSSLLAVGHEVIVVDKFLFGGDPLLPFVSHPRFACYRRDVCVGAIDPLLEGVDTVYHLAALVGFPACQEAGEQETRRVNVEATKLVFEAAERMGVQRFVFASTYSAYGRATDSQPVTEVSPLFPQSVYAVTKIEAEQYLLSRTQASCSVVIPRFTTLFGLSPRTRFDLLVNQFVLEALIAHRLVLFQGGYRRAFVHVRDVVRALVLFASAPVDAVRGEIFNVGHEEGNFTKADIVEMIRSAIPGVTVENRDLSFGGDMRDVAVDCRRLRDRLDFAAAITVEKGIHEVQDAITSGLIRDPLLAHYRNHAALVD